MDTDIDNYSHKDILTLLKISDNSDLTIELLHKKVKSAIDVINKNAADLENPESLRQFFKQCFLRVQVVKGFEITEPIRQSLDLEPIPTVYNEVIETRPEEIQNITRNPVFPGNLPPAVPNEVTNSTAPLAYSRGLVNPVNRETIKYLLTINSKFRSIYNKNDCIVDCTQHGKKKVYQSQGDALRDKSLCLEYKEIYKRVRETEKCTKSTNTGFIGKPSDFYIELQEPLVNVVSIKLAGLEMMNGYYPISEYLGTNTIIFHSYEYPIDEETGEHYYHLADHVTENILTLSDGSYNVEELQNKINNYFKEAVDTKPLSSVRLNYDCLTGKYHFVICNSQEDCECHDPPANKGWGIQVCFVHPKYPNRHLFYNLGWMMGFREAIYSMSNDYYRQVTTTNLLGINADAPANLIGTQYFLLEVDDYNNNNPVVINYNCNTEHSFNIRNILAKIPNAAQNNDILFEDSSDRIFKSRRYFGPVRIQKLRIRILDENGRQININNSDFTVNIEVETLNAPYKHVIK